jgi:hypothetical protein
MDVLRRERRSARIPQLPIGSRLPQALQRRIVKAVNARRFQAISSALRQWIKKLIRVNRVREN